MCNLYSETKGVDAIRAIVKGFKRGHELNFPPLPGIFPDGEAPVVTRLAKGERGLAMMRWGIPGPTIYGSRPVTNVRNASSSHWKKWLQLDEGKGGGRCLVPATAFSEYRDGPSPKDIVWFARPQDGGDTRPLFFFAGIWREWEGIRGTKAAPVEGKHRVYSFLTTDPNVVVQPVHAKAMPVVLTTAEQCDAWLDGETAEALKLQTPAPVEALTVVARGRSKKDDGNAEVVI
jgi:putative SOS response-associated peptidase YedK